MYSLAMLLVTLTFIYAYRIYKAGHSGVISNFSIKNWIIFAICSLAGAYTHYYALMASGLINLFLMISLIVGCVKNKEFNKNMKAFIVAGAIQIVLYIPWLLSLLVQMGQVSKGFWINITFPDTLIEFFTFQFTGNLGDTAYVNPVIAMIWGLAITIYMVFLYVKNIAGTVHRAPTTEKVINPAVLAIGLFLGIALAACIVSLVIWRPIIYARYMLCVMGLFMFFLAYTMEKKGNKYINLVMCIASLLISLYVNIDFININYDESNTKPIDYVKEDIGENDIILMSNEGSGFVLAVNFPENKSYFYDQNGWNCEEAYRAFSKNFETVYDLDFLEDYTGRVWIINTTHYSVLEQIQDKYNVDLIKQDMFSVEYKQYQYSISLIEK